MWILSRDFHFYKSPEMQGRITTKTTPQFTPPSYLHHIWVDTSPAAASTTADISTPADAPCTSHPVAGATGHATDAAARSTAYAAAIQQQMQQHIQ